MDHVSFVKDVYAAFGRGDIAAVLSALHADIAWHQAEGHPYQPGGQPWIGPEAVLQGLFLRIAADWEGFAVHPQVFHDAGSTVVVEGRYTGTHKRTGRPLDAQLCHLWTVRGGRVARFQQYVDTAQLRDVMR
jgi:uncharacterized protein